MAVPKRPENNLVDTRKGDKFPLYPSGLAPVYVKKRVCKIYLIDLIAIKCL